MICSTLWAGFTVFTEGQDSKATFNSRAIHVLVSDMSFYEEQQHQSTTYNTVYRLFPDTVLFLKLGLLSVKVEIV